MLCKHELGKQESWNPHPHLHVGYSHFPPILNGHLSMVWNLFPIFTINIRPLLNGHLNYSRKTGSLGISKWLLLLLNSLYFISQSRECVVWIFYFNVWSHYFLSHLYWANSRISFTELQLSKVKAIVADVLTL